MAKSLRGSLALGAVTVSAVVHAMPSPPGLIPVLDRESVVALEAASDGTDRREESWVRLLEHAATWPRDPAALESAIAAAPVVARPEWASWGLDPDSHRGSLVRISGRLEQETVTPWPGGDRSGGPRLAEWFIRPESEGAGEVGAAIQVWVVDPPPPWSEATPRRVEVVGRFLRFTDLTGRDGLTRRFPTLVGVAFAPPANAAAPIGPGTLLAVLVAVMLPIAIWLRKRASRSSKRGTTIAPPLAVDAALDLDEDREVLPHDPAEALAVLSGNRDRSTPSQRMVESAERSTAH